MTMPRVIVKCKYYSTAKTKRSLSGLLQYIGTRSGVEKLGDGWKTENASKVQVELLNHFTEACNNCKRLPEYREYINSKTKGVASECISAIIENNPDLLNEKTYLDYIATRPRAERIEGTHGLFSDEGVALDINKEAERLRKHTGNVFTVIVSLKREDAERLGYNNAQRWRDLVRSKIDVIAKEHNISLSSLKWYGAFHNESHHPHIHLMLYSENKEKPGFITNKGIDRLRHLFGTEIFKYELVNIYDEQTKLRNKLNADAKEKLYELAENIKTNLVDNGEFVMKFIALAEKLKTVNGKKMYGYLPKKAKEMVNYLVDLLEKDEDIKKMYELWYEAKCAVYKTYTDNFPPMKPLSSEEAFKPIRNAIIKEADELGKVLSQSESAKKTSSENNNSKQNTQTTNSTTVSKNAQSHIVTRNEYIASSITRLGNSISKIFKERFDEQEKNVPIDVDSKLKREIEAKKKGQSISM